MLDRTGNDFRLYSAFEFFEEADRRLDLKTPQPILNEVKDADNKQRELDSRISAQFNHGMMIQLLQKIRSHGDKVVFGKQRDIVNSLFESMEDDLHLKGQDPVSEEDDNDRSQSL